MEVFFYILSTLILISAIGVVSFDNPVYSVLCLIFCFVHASGLFILLKAEFVAMLLIIVYVGAVAVLFLFVVMMIDYKSPNRNHSTTILLSSIVIAIIFFSALLFILYIGFQQYKIPSSVVTIPADLSNVKAIGGLLYTDYLLNFELAGIMLLIAMVGSISLVHRTRKNVKKQDIGQQLSVSATNRLKLAQVRSGEGIDVS